MINLLSHRCSGFAILVVFCLGLSSCATNNQLATTTTVRATNIIRQTNEFTASKQDHVSVAIDNASRVLAVWDSRRQQEGRYGVYGRWFNLQGAPLSDEFAINKTTTGHQRGPVVAADGSGGMWVAWTSTGAENEGIFARHLDGATSTWSSPIMVNDKSKMLEWGPTISCNSNGQTLIAWNIASDEGTHIAARCFNSDHLPLGKQMDLGSSKLLHSTLPVVATLPDGCFAISYQVLKEDGRPGGLFMRLVDPMEQEVSDEWALAPQGCIEPSIASTNKGAVVSWLAPRKGAYQAVVQILDERGQALGMAKTLSKEGDVWISGVHVRGLPKGGYAVAWNEDRSGQGKSRVRLQTFEEGGEEMDPPMWLDASLELGHHLTSATSASAMATSLDGILVVGFSGHGLGTDSSSANIAIVGVAPTTNVSPLPIMPAPILKQLAEAPTPPTFDPNYKPLDPSPDSIRQGLYDFEGVTYTGWDPPDPDIAAGPEHLVEVTNGAIAFFTHNGTLLYQVTIAGSSGFWGNQGATGFVFDPEVVWDPHSNRFVAMACEREGNSSYFLLAVSDDSDPNGSWNKYRINVTSFDSNIDSPNLAVDDEVIYLAADFFSPDSYLVLCVDKSDALVGDSLEITQVSLSGSGNQSLGLPVTWDANSPQYLIQSSEGTGNGVNFNEIRLWSIENPLGTPSMVSHDLSVPTYAYPQHPAQQGTSVRPYLFEPRFWSCVQRGGSVWAVHHVNSSRARVRWYEIDMQGWPDSVSTPQLAQWGEIDAGSDVSTYFPSIAVDEDGNAAICFSRSSSSEYISMCEVRRQVDDPTGEFQPMNFVRTSTSPATTGRWGDYSGAAASANNSGRFWLAHEWTNSSNAWRTWITAVDLEPILLGACCVGPSCIEIPQANCDAGGGIWMGDGTTCKSGVCDTPVCPADINGDGYVNVSDLLTVIDQWGLTNSPADVNEDGIVNVSDLLIVVGSWGPCE